MQGERGWFLEGHYGGSTGWEIVVHAEDRDDAMRLLNDYQTNAPEYRYRVGSKALPIPQWPEDEAAYLPYHIEQISEAQRPGQGGNWMVYRHSREWDGPVESREDALAQMRERAAEDGLVEPKDGKRRDLSHYGFLVRVLNKAGRHIIVVERRRQQYSEGRHVWLDVFCLTPGEPSGPPTSYWLCGRARHILDYDYDAVMESFVVEEGTYAEDLRESLSRVLYDDPRALTMSKL